jgi:hypothetical protein
MYGSYPEMTISMRYLAAKWERMKLFLSAPPPKPWPLAYDEMVMKAERIRNEPRQRECLPEGARRVAYEQREERGGAE